MKLGTSDRLVLKMTLLAVLASCVHGWVWGNAIGQRYQNYTFNRKDGQLYMNTSFDFGTQKNELNNYKLVSRALESGSDYRVYTVVFGSYNSINPILFNTTINNITADWTLMPNSTMNLTSYSPIDAAKVSNTTAGLVNISSNYTANTVIPELTFDNVLALNWASTNNDARIKNYKLVVPVNQSAGTYSYTDDAKFLDFLRDVGQLGGPYGMLGYEQNGAFIAQALRYYPLDFAGQPLTNSTGISGNVSGINDVYHYNILLADRNYGEYPFIASRTYEDYKLNRIAYNWPFWFMVCVSLFYLLIANYLDDVVEYDEYMNNNWRTFFPFYSMYWTSSEVIFTRRIRLGIFALRLSAMGWFNALMVKLYIQRWDHEDVSWAIRLALFPFCAAVFSLFWWLFIGVLANMYYRTHRLFVTNMRTIEDVNLREAEIERYEEESFAKLHIFYFALIIFGLFFLVMPIWFLYWHTLENQGYWLLMVLISFGWSLLIFEPIFTIMGKMAAFAGLMKLGGYWFDYDLHEEFRTIHKIN